MSFVAFSERLLWAEEPWRCCEYQNMLPQTLSHTEKHACVLYIELWVWKPLLFIFMLCYVKPVWTPHERIPPLSKSADGSAENQMIVESDDFNGQLYPSLLYKFLRSELIYSSFSASLLTAWTPIKAVCFGLSTPVAFFSSNYPGSLGLVAAHVAVRGPGLPVSGCTSLLCSPALPSLLLLNPVSLTSWSKTPCEVQSFHPGIFFNPLSSWSAGLTLIQIWRRWRSRSLSW